MFASARAQLAATQGKPNSEERASKVEGIATAKLEAVLLEQDIELEPIREALNQYFGSAESPSEADSAFQERVNNAVDQLRDLHQRKIRSLVAQAQAEELATTEGAVAAAPAASAAKFCKQCGAAV